MGGKESNKPSEVIRVGLGGGKPPQRRPKRAQATKEREDLGKEILKED